MTVTPLPILAAISCCLQLRALRTLQLPSYCLIVAVTPVLAHYLTQWCVRRVQPRHASNKVNISLAVPLVLAALYITTKHDWTAAVKARGDERMQARHEPWQTVETFYLAQECIFAGVLIDVLGRIYAALVVAADEAMIFVYQDGKPCNITTWNIADSLQSPPYSLRTSFVSSSFSPLPSCARGSLSAIRRKSTRQPSTIRAISPGARTACSSIL